MQPFKPGVGHLAVELGVQVLPMRIEVTRPGFYEGKWFPTPRAKVRVYIGKPLRFQPGTDPAMAVKSLEDAVRSA
jgi:1-acyl-sn-glycerol-3-phosphate acyltransferase